MAKGPENLDASEQPVQEQLIVDGESLREVVHGLKELQASLERIIEFKNLSRGDMLEIARHSLGSIDLIRTSLDMDRDGNKQENKG